MSGFVVWFTGLSGAGKSTLSGLLSEELRRRGVHVEVLDGDEVRTHLSKGLGFSREDRDVNIRRIGFVAKLIARTGGCAITAAISPYRAVRDEQRAQIERFVEVYCKCDVPVLAARDPKGLYKKALAGEIKHFTGIDDPYEPPEAADVVLDTGTETREESLGKILAKLEALGYVGPAAPRAQAGAFKYSHVIGVDDAPFEREARGRVMVVATAFAGPRLEGVLTTRVRRDGSDATEALAACIGGSRYAAHTRLVLLQGIALAGFNVVDIHGLSEALGMAVLVVARKAPRLRAMREALLGKVRGGARKWALIEEAGPMEPCAGVMVQRAGISLEDAALVVSRLSVNGAVPEPLRMAHLIAGGVTTGQSRGRT